MVLWFCPAPSPRTAVCGACRPSDTPPPPPRDITLRYKETRRQKQQGGSDQDSTVGNADGHAPVPDTTRGPAEDAGEGAPALS